MPLHVNRALGGIACALAAIGSLQAASYEFRSVGRDPGASGVPVTVNFKSGAAPSEAELAKARWTITAYTSDDDAGTAAQIENITLNNYAVYHQVIIDLCFPSGKDCLRQFPTGTKRYTVIFDKAGQIATKTQTYNRTTPPGGITKSSGRDDSNLYLFGGINAAVGTRPTFSIDSFVDFHPALSGFGINASVKTDNRKVVDPDSFVVKLDYLRLLATPTAQKDRQITFQGVGLKLDYAGVEFDRSRKNLNFVTSPYILLPFTHNVINPGDGAVLGTWNFELKLGLEGGNNFRNTLNPDGLGGFVRTLGGGTNTFIVRKVLGLQRIQLTTVYDVRLPDKAELFSNTTQKINGQDVPIYRFSRQARHHLTNELSLMFTDYWGFSFKHEYGSLPPTFNFIDHKLSMGLTFKLKEK